MIPGARVGDIFGFLIQHGLYLEGLFENLFLKNHIDSDCPIDYFQVSSYIVVSDLFISRYTGHGGTVIGAQSLIWVLCGEQILNYSSQEP